MDLSAPSAKQQQASRRIVVAAIAVVAIAYFGWIGTALFSTSHAVAPAAGGAAETMEAAPHHVAKPPAPAVYSVLPFVLLLLAIAVFPLFPATARWWEMNWQRLAFAGGLGVVTLAYYGLVYGHGVIDHATGEMTAAGLPAAVSIFKKSMFAEYIPFMTLLFSLYVISGGVVVGGHIIGKPHVNVGMLATGAVLASLIGTTGAAMLLIRPLLNANAKRRYVVHTVVFFIFIICNVGGCLLPLGDPPSFLGYLAGVQFTWTLRLWPEWLFMNGCLLSIYYGWDLWRYRQEHHATVEAAPEEHSTYDILGRWNFLWLAGVIFCVALLDPAKPFPGTNWHAPVYFREVAMLIFTALSLLSTNPEFRHKNAFNYDAILEVAALFSGIFLCMQAPLQVLDAYGPSLGFNEPWKYYWGSGTLSSFLDNAPTYVVFFETARSSTGSAAETMAGVDVRFLAAVSLGSVFMGAMTYIGNGPNFMVKTIAEKNQVIMPSFFGYMLYSCTILLPLSIIMTLIFL